jgi:hypothetical protein
LEGELGELVSGENIALTDYPLPQKNGAGAAVRQIGNTDAGEGVRRKIPLREAVNAARFYLSGCGLDAREKQAGQGQAQAEPFLVKHLKNLLKLDFAASVCRFRKKYTAVAGGFCDEPAAGGTKYTNSPS